MRRTITKSEVAAVTLGPIVTSRVYGNTRLGDILPRAGEDLVLIVLCGGGDDLEERAGL